MYNHQLQRNVGIMDPLLFSNDITDSWFNYTGYRTVKNFYKFRKDVTPDKDVQWGGTSVFRIPINADKWGPTQLIFTVGPVTLGTPSTTHDARLVDWAGYFAWEKIELVYSTNELYTLLPEECYLRTRKQSDQEHLSSIRELVGGDLTDVQREAAATGAQTFIVDLPFPHTRATSRWVNLMQLSHEPQIHIKWKNLNQIVQMGDGATPSAVLSNVHLRNTYAHLHGDERDHNTGITEEEHGLINLFEEYRYEKINIPSGSSGEVALTLRNFKTSAKGYTLILRNLAEVNPGAGDEPDYTNELPLDTYNLETSDGKVHEPVDGEYYKKYLWHLYHNGVPGLNIYEWTHAMQPDDSLNSSGSLNYGLTSNLQLKVKLLGTLTEDVEATVIVQEWNTHQHMRGDMLKNFK